MKSEIGCPSVRLAFLLSHPTQFEVPFFQFLARQNSSLKLTAFYWKTNQREAIFDPELGHPPGWDFSLTEGYDWNVLPEGREDYRKAIRNRILGGQFDALIVNGYGSWHGRMAIEEAAKAGIPVLLRSDSTFLQSRSFTKEMIKGMILHRMFRKIAGFLVTGSQAKKYIRHYGVPEDRIFIFPYAVDNKKIGRACEMFSQERNKIRADLGIASNAVVVLAVVKFVKREGGMDLIRAHEMLAYEHPGLVLLMVGDGIERDSFEHYVKSRQIPRIIFSGYQPYSQLPKFYAIANVFVHPAHFEPWGVSVNEAMACGLPIIASNLVGAAYDLVKEGENGFVYKANDAVALRETIKKFLNEAERASQMGKRSLDSINDWGYDACLTQLNQVVQSVIRPKQTLMI